MFRKKKIALLSVGLMALLGGSALANPYLSTDRATGYQHRAHPRYQRGNQNAIPSTNNQIRYDQNGNRYVIGPNTPNYNNGYNNGYNHGYYDSSGAYHNNNGYYDSNGQYRNDNGRYDNGYYRNDGRYNSGYYNNGYYNDPYNNGQYNARRGIQVGPFRIGY